ncbi:MAG: DNA-binding response regulator [Saprospiraceae bacterium]|nr:MAG: DNA-binding response regulator [Saprospiraceae bacterium]
MLYHVHIAEDLPRLAKMLRENLELSPDFKVTGHAEDGQALLDQLAEAATLPHIILMDIKMPRLNGIETTARLKAMHPQIKIVMATVFDDEEHIFDAILAGADGYLLKDEKPEVLHRSLLEVMHGGAPMSPAIARKAIALLRRQPEVVPKTTTSDLSDREIEILDQISRGLRYRQVAENLHISEGTVRKHIENIYRKLQVHNKVSAVDKGKKLGII